jgi:hypothetical protein
MAASVVEVVVVDDGAVVRELDRGTRFDSIAPVLAQPAIVNANTEAKAIQSPPVAWRFGSLTRTAIDMF